MSITGNKVKAVLDEDNNRYILSPIPETGITIGDALRAIKSSTKISWRKIATFCGLQNQTIAFKVAYVARKFEEKTTLSNFLVISGDKAYLYDKDHRPASSNPTHIKATISKSSDSLIKVTEDIPTKVTSRVTIADPLNRVLKMTVTPENGYIIGMNDINISNPDVAFVANGTPKTLNSLLKSIHFVGVSAGDASIKIEIDDGEGLVSSVNTVSIDMKVLQGVNISVPEINLPESANIVAGVDTPLTGITVSDADNKMLDLKITPFGCELYGFTDYIYPIESRGLKVTSGRPAAINDIIANLVVRTKEDCTKAQIGFEIVYGTTVIRKYLVLTIGTTIETVNNPKADEATVDETQLDD